jgi:hypothetical protein
VPFARSAWVSFEVRSTAAKAAPPPATRVPTAANAHTFRDLFFAARPAV